MKVYFYDVKRQRMVAVNNVLEIRQEKRQYVLRGQWWVLDDMDGKTHTEFPCNEYQIKKVEI